MARVDQDGLPCGCTEEAGDERQERSTVHWTVPANGQHSPLPWCLTRPAAGLRALGSSNADYQVGPPFPMHPMNGSDNDDLHIPAALSLRSPQFPRMRCPTSNPTTLHSTRCQILHSTQCYYVGLDRMISVLLDTALDARTKVAKSVFWDAVTVESVFDHCTKQPRDDCTRSCAPPTLGPLAGFRSPT